MQFVGCFDNEKEKYLMFDFETIDSFLSEEINNCGYDEFFNDIIWN